jgi:Fis family transcriptional regulator, factor for inversion stimulation protein
MSFEVIENRMNNIQSQDNVINKNNIVENNYSQELNPELNPELNQSSQNNTILRTMVEKTVKEYFNSLDGQEPKDVYALVLKEVEVGLLKTVMNIAGYNQSLAARYLGLARGTLRKKLSIHNIEG